MEKRSIYIFLGLISLSIGIFLSTLLATSAFKQVKLSTGSISVKGCAEKNIRSDFVKWGGSITVSKDTPIQTFEQYESDIQVFLEYLKGRGINEEIIALSPISMTAIYEVNDQGNSTNKIERHSLSQEFSLSSTDIALISELSKSVSSLIKEGLTIYSSTPQYYYLKLDELKIALLCDAAKDAKQRAEVLVTNCGGKVGTIRSAHQGIFQITPTFSNSISDYGEYDTSSIEKRIKAVVTMEFSIE